MWLRDGYSWRLLARLATVLVLAGLTAGCFQPMYASRSPNAAAPDARTALSQVDIALIDGAMGSAEARIGQVVRNELVFATTGGTPVRVPLYRLRVSMTTQKSSLIVDITTGRPEFEIVGLDATYTLTEAATNKVVVESTAFSRVSYDAPGQQQRFARDRGRRDAEDRAARILAEQIKNRLASFFVAGT